MAIDPRELDGDDLKSALDSALGGMDAADMERMAGARPAEHPKDERGRIQGRIINTRGKDVFVDIGAKAEAFVSLDEFDAEKPPQPGELHMFLIQGPDHESGLMRLSLREAMREADLESLQVGDVIEARVTGMNVGGMELNAKGIRAFMPKSQVDVHRIEDFTPFIGRRIECEITEINRRGGSLVVSRRKLLERQREQQRAEVKDQLAEGQVRKGIVRRLTDFGAFVDIGGIEGLLHIGDLSYGRVKHPRDVVKVDDEIEVQILKIDRVKDRISLGMKQLAPDPWNVVEANYRVGNTVDGRVVKLMEFGAFVELQPGVEGLIPVSEMSWTQRVRHPKDVLKEADAVRVSVLAVDLEKRKLTLSLKALGEDPWKTVIEKYPPDSVVSGLVLRLAEFGAFVQLEEGVEGLVHISEMSDQRIRTPGDVVKIGDVVQIRVKSVDLEQRRISLSLRMHRPAEQQFGDAQPVAEAAPSPALLRKKKKVLKGGLD
ncbi:MAG: S1 RNA-binding domain-containing protein [Planctomycetes bacterium]|nr:S1 RNA-binding domain-containing protein [Planctomycetota bacterium]